MEKHNGSVTAVDSISITTIKIKTHHDRIICIIWMSSLCNLYTVSIIVFLLNVAYHYKRYDNKTENVTTKILYSCFLKKQISLLLLLILIYKGRNQRLTWFGCENEVDMWTVQWNDTSLFYCWKIYFQKVTKWGLINFSPRRGLRGRSIFWLLLEKDIKVTL